jgi:hypothetical protein
MVSEIRKDSEVILDLELENEQLKIRIAELEDAIEFATAPDMWVETDDNNVYEYKYFDWYVDVLSEALEKTDKQSLAEIKVATFRGANIPAKAKAGCIGEFSFTIEGGKCCPQCWNEKSDDCELCLGESDENGISDLVVDVPWNVQKEIWLRMNKFAAKPTTSRG